MRDRRLHSERANGAKTSHARYICGNVAMLLSACLLMIPLLVFIAMPNLFIITGQRQRMEAYFNLVCFIAICLAETGFILLCHESRDAERATFRDALFATVGLTAAALGIFIGAGLFARLMWYPLTYLAYAVRVVWDCFADIAMWLWGGDVYVQRFRGRGNASVGDGYLRMGAATWLWRSFLLQ